LKEGGKIDVVFVLEKEVVLCMRRRDIMVLKIFSEEEGK
jgi:hypothetical protein